MTPEQKANDLVRRFIIKYNGWSTNEHTLSKPIAELKKGLFQKQWYVPLEMAIMCVDEVIEQWQYIDTYLADLGGKLNPNLKYWYNVKQILEKM